MRCRQVVAGRGGRAVYFEEERIDSVCRQRGEQQQQAVVVVPGDGVDEMPPGRSANEGGISAPSSLTRRAVMTVTRTRDTKCTREGHEAHEGHEWHEAHDMRGFLRHRPGGAAPLRPVPEGPLLDEKGRASCQAKRGPAGHRPACPACPAWPRRSLRGRPSACDFGLRLATPGQTVPQGPPGGSRGEEGPACLLHAGKGDSGFDSSTPVQWGTSGVERLPPGRETRRVVAMLLCAVAELW